MANLRKSIRVARHPDDADLLAACLKGDDRAWDQLLERYGRLIYSIPRRYGFSDTDADEVFQSVVVILFQNLSRLRDHRKLPAWLITTTHRECWRIGKSSPHMGDLDQQIVDVGSPSEDQLVAWEEQHLVRTGMEQLGRRCRELLHALFIAAPTPDYKAIANQLGMKIGSIGPTRARCFKELEQILLNLGFQPRVDQIEGESGSTDATVSQE